MKMTTQLNKIRESNSFHENKQQLIRRDNGEKNQFSRATKELKHVGKKTQ